MKKKLVTGILIVLVLLAFTFMIMGIVFATIKEYQKSHLGLIFAGVSVALFFVSIVISAIFNKDAEESINHSNKRIKGMAITSALICVACLISLFIIGICCSSNPVAEVFALIFIASLFATLILTAVNQTITDNNKQKYKEQQVIEEQKVERQRTQGSRSKKITCSYCGCDYNKEKEKCPNCGGFTNRRKV